MQCPSNKKTELIRKEDNQKREHRDLIGFDTPFFIADIDGF